MAALTQIQIKLAANDAKVMYRRTGIESYKEKFQKLIKRVKDADWVAENGKLN